MDFGSGCAGFDMDNNDKRTAFVTGADRGLGLAITKELALRGWPELAALAASHPDLVTPVPLDIASDASIRAAIDAVRDRTNWVDLVVNNAGVINVASEAPIRGKQHYDAIMRVYNVNAVGALRVVDAVLPLMDASDVKRLCFVSSEAGSVERCDRTAWYGYCMSKRALNMGVAALFDDLRPRGFSFRLFHPGYMKTYMSGSKNQGADLEPFEVAAIAVPYFVEPLPDQADEESLVMRDWLGREWPF
jgi:NAD(P)-dependent dehydrogenase (short-subunit alcohol dehydrogenase family)